MLVRPQIFNDRFVYPPHLLWFLLKHIREIPSKPPLRHDTPAMCLELVPTISVGLKTITVPFFMDTFWVFPIGAKDLVSFFPLCFRAFFDDRNNTQRGPPVCFQFPKNGTDVPRCLRKMLRSSAPPPRAPRTGLARAVQNRVNLFA